MRVVTPQHRGVCAPAGQPKSLNPTPAATPQRRAFSARAPGRCGDLNPNNVNAYSSSTTTTANNNAPRSSTIAQGLARQILAQPGIEGDPLAFLDVSEAYWRALRHQKHEPQKKGPTVVKYADGPLPRTTTTSGAPTAQPDSPPQPAAEPGAASTATRSPSQQQLCDFDVVICGGTLGLFLATALQLRGWRVAIVEKRLVQGRNQEWNISWGELETLVDLGLLSREELRQAVVSEFNPIRVGFMGGEDMWTSDVLNLGVQPKKLLEALRRRFSAAGGVVYENTAFRSATIHEDGILLKLTPGGSASPLAVGDTNRPNGLAPTAAPVVVGPRSLTCRLLLDCMGHYSDIVKQIRGRVKPDGMCMVVGSCAEGFPSESNVSADLLYSLSHARLDTQLFWEAFPAEGGAARTTYMFAYSDAHPDRPTFEQLLDTYFEMLPQYQGQPLEQLRFKRVLFGGFPCYSNGPLAPAFDRVMQIGDASAAQSPLSFGGFGSMMRHLGRLTRGLNQALAEDRLRRADLGWLQPYQPSLSASWLFQRSMSFGVGQVSYPPNYPFTPPYYNAAADAARAAADEDASAATAAAALLMGAGAGPAAAFQEAVAMAAARFAAGSADPADYFHEEAAEGAAEGTAATAAVATAAAPLAARTQSQQVASQRQQQQQPEVQATSSSVSSSSSAQSGPLFERDFRNAPGWMRLPYTHVNEILGTNFGVMGVLGDRVLRPFLQDTIQVVPLSLSMMGMMLANPVTVSRVLLQVGPRTLVGWFAHYAALVAYSLTYQLLRPLRQLVPDYGFQRLLDALEYGSGSDYKYHGPPAAAPPADVGKGRPLGAAAPAAAAAPAGAPSKAGEAAAPEGAGGEPAEGAGGDLDRARGGKGGEPVPVPVPAAAMAAGVAAAAPQLTDALSQGRLG